MKQTLSRSRVCTDRGAVQREWIGASRDFGGELGSREGDLTEQRSIRRPRGRPERGRECRILSNVRTSPVAIQHELRKIPRLDVRHCNSDRDPSRDSNVEREWNGALAHVTNCLECAERKRVICVGRQCSNGGFGCRQLWERLRTEVCHCQRCKEWARFERTIGVRRVHRRVVVPESTNPETKRAFGQRHRVITDTRHRLSSGNVGHGERCE